MTTADAGICIKTTDLEANSYDVNESKLQSVNLQYFYIELQNKKKFAKS